MAAIPHPIAYQGSKRRLAAKILAFVPDGVATLYEPFCGSAAISLAAAAAGKAERIRLNDSLVPLSTLWRRILEDPKAIAEDYLRLWHAQDAAPARHYDAVRAAFNRDGDPAKLLFLLARCVKSAVRFNAAGEFNQSPDHRRRGTRPERMRQNLLAASALLRERTVVSAGDYAAALTEAGPGDVVYLDPPYQGTSGARDARYHQQLDRWRLVAELERLLDRGVDVIVSFDGRCGRQHYGRELPAELGLLRLELAAGRSSQATLLGRSEQTVESLYLSPQLVPAAQR
ncbi:MAG: DNA adenine methylase [Myxococcales bacterium]|nr:DNA adenine methylase [Myxococcales bacterium]